jgi:hypothetical protein
VSIFRFSNRRGATSFSSPLLAVVGALAMTALLVLAAPLAAHAAPVVSQSEGRLVTASLLGVPSTAVALLAGASAVDATGTGGPFTSDVPLDATALQALNLQASSTNLFGSNGIIQLGTVGQFAQAQDDGSSVAFSGTVTSAPSLLGIATTPTGGSLGTPGAGNSALIAVGDPATSPVSISASIGTLAASAQETAAGVQSGDYVLSDLNIVAGGTLVSAAVTPVGSILDTLLAVVNPLIATPITNPLAGGDVTVSLDDLLAAAGAATLDDLAPGTDLLSFLPAAAAAKITSLTDAVLAEVTTATSGLGVLAAATVATALGVANTSLSLLTGLATGSLALAVTALAQLTINTQSVTSGAFTQNALTVGIGPVGSIASVALASATVGPNTPLAPPAPPAPPAPSGGSGGSGGGGTSTTTTLAATGVDPAGGAIGAAALSLLGGILVVGSLRRRPQSRV